MAVQYNPQHHESTSAQLTPAQRARQAQIQERRHARLDRRQQAREQRRLKLEERRHTRLERLAFWAVEGTVDELKDRPIGVLLSSTEGRLAASLLVSVVLGFLIDFSVSPAGAPPEATYVVLGGVAAAITAWIAGGIGGAGGAAVLGGLWGWLAGKIAESLASDAARQGLDSGNQWSRKLLAWFAAFAVGWAAGRLARNLYARTTNGAGKLISVAILITAVTLVLLDLGIRHVHYVNAVRRLANSLNHHSWIIVILTTTLCIGVVIVSLAVWFDQWRLRYRFERDRYTGGVVFQGWVHSEDRKALLEWLMDRRWVVYLFLWSVFAAGGAIWAAVAPSPKVTVLERSMTVAVQGPLLLTFTLLFKLIVLGLGSALFDAGRVTAHMVATMLRGPAARRARQAELDRRVRESTAFARLDPAKKELIERLADEILQKKTSFDDPRVKELLARLYD